MIVIPRLIDQVRVARGEVGCLSSLSVKDGSGTDEEVVD